MTRRTLTKIGRTYIQIKTGNKISVPDLNEDGSQKLTAEGDEQHKIEDESIIIKRDKPLPPTPREKMQIEWRGTKFFVMMAPGQHINKEKAWKREMKRREDESMESLRKKS